MTFSELARICFSVNPEPIKFYIFEDVENAERWISINCEGKDCDAYYELIAVFQSDNIPEYTLKDRWCNATVQVIYAVSQDTMVVVIEDKENME